MMKNLKAKIEHKIAKWQFFHACDKLRRKHNKVNDCRFKILKTCLNGMDEIGIPVTPEDKKLMTEMLNLYDKTLQELGADVKRFRGYVAECNNEVVL